MKVEYGICIKISWHTKKSQYHELTIIVTFVTLDIYLNHIQMDLREQVMFTLQKKKNALLILLLRFITLYYNCLLNV